jgi:nitroimidazol reductase NimA-like FMN-containing flavoprotein (pyridoxamine 5'-phosphate oxidase superfamily)
VTQHPVEPNAAILDILALRLIATVGTVSDDGTILLTPVWYQYEGGRLYMPTGGGSHKARNVRARPGVTVLVDQRHPERHRWASAVGTEGEATYGRLIEAFDDVTLVVTPTAWRVWTPGALSELAERHGRAPTDVADWFVPWD